MFVVSTATTGMKFIKYSRYIENQVPQELFSVTIRGGANMPLKTAEGTPAGVTTEISQRELEFLLQDEMFLTCADAGYFSIIGRESDLKNAIRDMKAKDRCAPKTPGDYRDIKNNTDGFGIRTGRSVEEIARPN